MFDHPVDFQTLPNPRARVEKIAAEALAALRTPIPKEVIDEAVRSSTDYDSLRSALGQVLSASGPLSRAAITIPKALRMCAYLGFVDVVHPVKEGLAPVSPSAMTKRLQRLHGIPRHHSTVQFLHDTQTFEAITFSLSGIAYLDLLQEVVDRADEYDDEDHAIWQKDFLADAQAGQLPELAFESTVVPTFLLSYLYGRYEGFKAFADRYPYWQFHQSTACRGGHGIPDGLIAAVSDPVWDRALPPHAPYCDCHVIPVTFGPRSPDDAPPPESLRQCPLYAHDKRDAPWLFLRRVIEAHYAECRQADTAQQAPDGVTEPMHGEETNAVLPQAAHSRTDA